MRFVHVLCDSHFHQRFVSLFTSTFRRFWGTTIVTFVRCSCHSSNGGRLRGLPFISRAANPLSPSSAFPCLSANRREHDHTTTCQPSWDCPFAEVRFHLQFPVPSSPYFHNSRRLLPPDSEPAQRCRNRLSLVEGGTRSYKRGSRA